MAGAEGITFAGAGALGQGLAALLHRTSAVTVLARPATAQRLLHDGVLATGDVVIRSGPGRPGKVGVIDTPAAIPADDAVIFTTKAAQLSGLAEAVERSWPRRGGWVAGLQNGVGKDRRLSAVFGTKAVVGAATMTAAARAGGGSVQVTSVGITYFGEFDGTASARTTDAAAAFDSAGMPVSVTPDITSVLWMKWCNSAALFGVSALARLDTATLLSRSDAVEAYLDLVAESAAVAGAEGVAIRDHHGLPPIASYLDQNRAALVSRIVAQAWPGGQISYSSMAQDVLAGRRTEVDEVIGGLIQRADSLGVAVPRLGVVYRLIRSLPIASASPAQP